MQTEALFWAGNAKLDSRMLVAAPLSGYEVRGGGDDKDEEGGEIIVIKVVHVVCVVVVDVEDRLRAG